MTTVGRNKTKLDMPGSPTKAKNVTMMCPNEGGSMFDGRFSKSPDKMKGGLTSIEGSPMRNKSV